MEISMLTDVGKYRILVTKAKWEVNYSKGEVLRDTKALVQISSQPKTPYNALLREIQQSVPPFFLGIWSHLLISSILNKEKFEEREVLQRGKFCGISECHSTDAQKQAIGSETFPSSC